MAKTSFELFRSRLEECHPFRWWKLHIVAPDTRLERCLLQQRQFEGMQLKRWTRTIKRKRDPQVASYGEMLRSNTEKDRAKPSSADR